jgi:S-adenosylmethionine synthetase
MVPIGGGAYSGKDPHKVDRAGAVLAREMALHSVINEANPWDTVQLTWAPGKQRYFAVNSFMAMDHGRQHLPQVISGNRFASLLPNLPSTDGFPGH